MNLKSMLFKTKKRKFLFGLMILVAGVTVKNSIPNKWDAARNLGPVGPDQCSLICDSTFMTARFNKKQYKYARFPFEGTALWRSNYEVCRVKARKDAVLGIAGEGLHIQNICIRRYRKLCKILCMEPLKEWMGGYDEGEGVAIQQANVTLVLETHKTGVKCAFVGKFPSWAEIVDTNDGSCHIRKRNKEVKQHMGDNEEMELGLENKHGTVNLMLEIDRIGFNCSSSDLPSKFEWVDDTDDDSCKFRLISSP
jgi:hypothetical protein